MPGGPAAPPPGWVRVDCHLHTVASGDAVLTLEQLAERAVPAGLDVVCITDHNVTSAAVTAAGRDLGVRVIVGEEIRTADGDVIGLFLTERIPYVLPVAVDIVEVFNAKIEDPGPNDRAAALATAYDLPGGAGSDAHDAPGVGAAYLEMPDFDGPAGFLAALAHARVTGEFRPHAPRYPRRPHPS